MDKINEALTRYVDKIYPSKEVLGKVLRSGKKLTFYHGVDPTSPHLHLGHSTNYLLMQKLQDLGHKVIFLIGSFTARIGDPSDKEATRKPLTRKEIEKNLKTYKEQVSKIINFKKPNPALVKFNSQWLDKLTLEEMFKLAANFTVQQIVERDLFRKRIRAKKPISLHEFLYPLMQGYDSVAMKVDGEIGGTDQTFNMLAGRLLVRKYLGKEKFVITTPLLVDPKTGKKLMSKSEGTYVALDDLPNDMYGKIMALPDETIVPCFKLCTDVPLSRLKVEDPRRVASGQSIKEIEEDLKASKVNPMDLKKQLAFEIVKIYHGEKPAKNAEKEFEKQFQKRDRPTKIAWTPKAVKPGKYTISKLMPQLIPTFAGTATISETKRLIKQGGLEFEGERIKDPHLEIEVKGGEIVKAGKRRIFKVKTK